MRCRRCGAALHLRKPDSIARTWAFLIAAYILYMPANVLPMMRTGSLFGAQSDTIMSGVVYLWHSGSWHIALVVFIASIVVPLAKMLSLTYLLITVQLGWTHRSLERTKLYRILEFVGPWSMLDVLCGNDSRGARPTERARVDSTGSGGGGVRRRGGPDDVCRDGVRSAAALEPQGGTSCMKGRADQFWKIFRQRSPGPSGSRRPQLIWLIPIVAVLIGGWLAVKTILDKGPTITITFKTAEGIEAGKTKVKYKSIDIGEVKSVGFSKDLENIVLTVEMNKGAAPHLVEDVRFWIVKPRISGGQVSGIGTLFSGSYIEMDPGKSSTRREEFEGLEVQPSVTGDMQGRHFILHG